MSATSECQMIDMGSIRFVTESPVYYSISVVMGFLLGIAGHRFLSGVMPGFWIAILTVAVVAVLMTGTALVGQDVFSEQHMALCLSVGKAMLLFLLWMMLASTGGLIAGRLLRFMELRGKNNG